MPKYPKMTLDKLAQVTQREFLAVGGRFDALDKRFDVVDKRFDALTNILDAVQQVLKHMQEDLKEIKSDVKTAGYDYLELKTRIERLEKKVDIRK